LKTEKRLRKIEEEIKIQAMPSTDTILGTAELLGERTKLEGKPHVVLSIGNRG